MGARAIAKLLVVALLLGGPVQPLALAQQPAEDTTAQQPSMQEPTVQPQPAEQAPPPEPTVQPSAAQLPPPPEPAPPPVMPPPAMPPPPPPAAQQPELFRETVVPSEPHRRVGTDIYDVGAGLVTVAKMPFNVVLCALGGVTGAGLFLVTLGSGYKASARVVEEGCRGPWIVRGDDLRPTGPRRDLTYP